MPSPRVLKFGGTALADGPAIQRAAAIVRRYGGPRPIVVVSAAAGVTRDLEATARSAAARTPNAAGVFGTAAGGARLAPVRVRHRSLLAQLGLDSELCDRHLRDLAGVLFGIEAAGQVTGAQMDFVRSFGERMSARILAAVLRAESEGRTHGAPATPLDAWDLGLWTDSKHGAAHPLPESTERLRRALAAVPGIPVVTGFVARDRAGNLTTLGPNGSDLTAALVAEATGAAALDLWKTVPGIMTADPKLVPGARPIPRLTFAEAELLARAGAAVLHPGAIAPARRARIPVTVRDARHPSRPGTRIAGEGRRAEPFAVVARQRPDGGGELVVCGARPRRLAPQPGESLAQAARRAHRDLLEGALRAR